MNFNEVAQIYLQILINDNDDDNDIDNDKNSDNDCKKIILLFYIHYQPNFFNF